MSVAYELPPQVRRIRPQAPSVVLPFPRPTSVPADDSVNAAGRRETALAGPPAGAASAPAIDDPRDQASLDVASWPAVDVVRAPVDGSRGPVACPSSSPTRNSSVRDLAGHDEREGRVRLTTRGRRLRALVCACALVAAGWITVSAVESALSSPLIPPSAPAVVQVHQGDTLWSIAALVAPQQDPRRVVNALRSANHLDSNTVRPGQQLRVPR